VAKQNFKGVIALMTVKGGAGKTTLSACLAAELHRQGKAITLVDADPQQSLTAWHQNGEAFASIPLIAEADETVATKAKEASKDRIVIVDTAGFANRAPLTSSESYWSM